MTIGVAIVSYNYGHLVAQAIGSVLAQSIQPDQIVVVDDASFDMTCDVAKKYDIKCIQRQHNLGTKDNFADILKNILNTDLCMFLGADNWLHPKYIEKTSALINDKVKVVGTDCFIVGEFGEKAAKQDAIKDWYVEHEVYPVWHYQKCDIHNANYIHGSALFDRQVALAAGGYEARDTIIDYDLWKRINERGYTLEKIDEPLLFYRKHRFNFNKSEIHDFIKETK